MTKENKKIVVRRVLQLEQIIQSQQSQLRSLDEKLKQAEKLEISGAGSKLICTVVEARNLPKLKFMGKADPYVLLSVGPEQAQSTTKRQDLNPRWGESFSFTLQDWGDNS